MDRLTAMSGFAVECGSYDPEAACKHHVAQSGGATVFLYRGHACNYGPHASLTRPQAFPGTVSPMSPAHFTIELDPSRDLVRIRLSGFFSVDDVERFQAELLLAHRRLGCGRRGGPLTINDISDMAIQSQDVMVRWGAFLADPAHRSRRLAFVVGSTLARMQLQRAIGSRDAMVFTAADEAERWLFANVTGTAA